MAPISSQRLEGEVLRALGLDPIVILDDVRAQVVDGVALLRGTVATLEEKEAAGRAAASVPGVRQVENRLAVTANHGTTDRRIMAAVDAALDALLGNVHRWVGAVVVDGIVHLRGHAPSAEAAEAAHHAVSRVEGVKSIINEIQIDAGAPMDEASVSNRVIQALVESGQVTPMGIRVDAVGGNIVLRGAVASPAEREQAEAIARTVPGVAHVENRLTATDTVARRAV